MPNKNTKDNSKDRPHDPSSPIEIIKTSEEIANKWVGRESIKKEGPKQNSSDSEELFFNSWKYNF